MKAPTPFQLTVPFALAGVLAFGTARSSDDLEVLVRSVPVTGSDIVGLRAEATIDAPVELVLSIFEDAKRAHEWIPMLGGRRTIKADGPGARWEYTLIDTPWPLEDRYFVTHATGKRLSGNRYLLKVASSAVDATLSPEEYEGKVHGTISRSDFYLTPIYGGTKTRLQMEVHMDPKGKLPAWIVNWAQQEWPIQFVDGLRIQTRKPDVAVNTELLRTLEAAPSH